MPHSSWEDRYEGRNLFADMFIAKDVEEAGKILKQLQTKGEVKA